MPDAPPAPEKRRRRWLRGLAITAFLLALLLVFAAQPVAFFLARREIAKFAGEQKLDVRYELEGSIWSRLRVRSVQVAPNQQGSGPAFKVGEIDVSYDLWKLLRGGLAGDFLGAVVLRDADIEIDPGKAVEKATEQTPLQPFVVPRFPLPASLVLENVSVRIKGGVQLAGLTLRLRPGADDEFRLERLEIPGLRPLGPLRAVTSYVNREALLRGLVLTPSLALEEAKLTPKGVFDARLRLEGGTATLHTEVAPALNSTFRAENVALRWPVELLVAPAPVALSGRLERIELEFVQLVGPKAGATAKVSAMLRDPAANEFGAQAIQLEAEGASQGGDFRNAASWQGKAALEITQPRAGQYAVDAARVGLSLAEGGQLTIRETTLTRGANRIVVSGSTNVTGAPQAALRIELAAPDLGQLALPGEPPPLLGALRGSGNFSWREGRPSGELSLEGTKLQARGGNVEQLTSRLRASEGMVWLDRLELRFDAANQLALGGYLRLEGERDFKLEVNGTLPRLELFEPALRANGVSQKLSGGAQLQWLLTGSAADPGKLRASLSGGGSARLTDFRVDTGVPISAELSATLAGEAFQVSSLRVQSGELELAANARIGDGLASLESIQLKRKGEALVGGHARVPFDVRTGRLTAEEKIDLDLATTHPLPLAELWTAAGRPGQPPAAGTLTLALKARGGLSSLVLDLGAQARQLQVRALEKLRAAEVDLHVGFRENKVALDGTIRQPQLQPVALKAGFPLELARLVETRTLPKDTPLSGSIRLPASDLRALLGVLPGLRFIEGRAAADVDLSGTLAQPRLRGHAQLDVPAARFENLSIPALRGLKFRLAFSDTEATVEQGDAEVAGGKLSLRGKASFPSAAKASLDFSVQGKDLLVARDESILVRTNAEVKITGPLATATVSGRIGLTKSRFLKDVEIVPLPLPGDKSAPPSAPPPPKPRGTGADLGIQVPPLRDWKFDLAIKTDDPFRVSGNLARGRLVADLRLTGTGGAPQLEGPVTIEQMTAKLPFSRLDVERGSLYFTPDQPLNPLIDLSGASQIRDRRVNVNVYGRASDPKTAFSSEPPLPQEQIVTLLATGATLDELRENSGALAGKAIVLTAQRLYHKIFPSKGREPEEDSFLDRFDLDIGNADPKTGAQTVSARYRISDKVIILSDFDQEGHFRGRVKYLIRFR